MVNFQIDIKTFLSEYWQKKPLVIRQALPNVVSALSGDELAGLALDEMVESRIVCETPGVAPFWQLKRGPFIEADFQQLPATHWTLLVQGVDRLIPEVASLLDHFDFIPQWRVDDVMISYAVKEGSVGPHYDNYDVFLYQATGFRRWSLTTKACHPNNRVAGVELRLMEAFDIEEEYLLEPGDMLYLPPHVGHHGVCVSEECVTYSFGYRQYSAQELWTSFGDYLSEQKGANPLYQDPNWNQNKFASIIPAPACVNAKQLMQQLLNDEDQLRRWFGCFVTTLDEHAEQQLPIALEEQELDDVEMFIGQVMQSDGLVRDGACRFAYQEDPLSLFVNGCEWEIEGVTPALVAYLANHRVLELKALHSRLLQPADWALLYDFWRLQWLQFLY